MNQDCTDWTIVNRSNGITYKFNAKEIYFGSTEEEFFISLFWPISALVMLIS